MVQDEPLVWFNLAGDLGVDDCCSLPVPFVRGEDGNLEKELVPLKLVLGWLGLVTVQLAPTSFVGVPTHKYKCFLLLAYSGCSLNFANKTQRVFTVEKNYFNTFE